MPARRTPARGNGKRLPKGIKDAITALVLDGKTPQAEIAREFGVSHSTVERLAKTIGEIDTDRINTINRGLPNMLSLIAASAGERALSLIDEEPEKAVRLVFATKLAMEAKRLAAPGAEAPGSLVLNFIKQLKVHATEERNAQPVIDIRALPEAGGDSFVDAADGSGPIPGLDGSEWERPLDGVLASEPSAAEPELGELPAAEEYRAQPVLPSLPVDEAPSGSV